jgi:predicted deacylase
LVSGNHGDEYEGQIILTKMCRDLGARDICGRVVILPAANLPAVRAGMRTSPFEQGEVGNLNRSFPGNPLGGPTAMMAHYIESVLLPASDYVFDLHSGGSSLMFLPCALMKKSSDGVRTQNTISLLRVFGAPITFVDLVDTDETLSGAARRCGVIHMGTELGGAGTVTPRAVAIGEQGLRRALAHIGLLRTRELSNPPETRFVAVGGPEYFVYSMEDGMFEPLVELGDEVEKGQPAGRIYFPERPWQEPSLATFQRSGMVLCKRVPGRTERGDCLFHLATDYVA